MSDSKSRLIVALDVPERAAALRAADQLTGHVGFFKVGLELFTREGPRLVEEIRSRGEKVFLDLKLHDIPETMRRAFLAAAQYQPAFVTVHCDQGESMLKEAALNNAGNTKALAVTLLTSINTGNLAVLGYKDQYVNDLSALVLLRARIARESGCQGVVCSGQEVARIKKELPDLIAVTPGIRPAWSVIGQDDQKRVVTPSVAVKNGADYVVVGRPIRDAKSPVEAAKKTAGEIESALA